MPMYHWQSAYTGEIVPDFHTAIRHSLMDVRACLRRDNRLCHLVDIPRFLFSWHYSKAGF